MGCDFGEHVIVCRGHALGNLLHSMRYLRRRAAVWAVVAFLRWGAEDSNV